ncbi:MULTISPECIES: hypothetical protein [unclassified Sphingomonas]|uniref:hypothetical protein n=1 Tax=unclassified Sphingomonas TaxID=196159 RepID=UPI0022B395F0|nr:hypothetical protein [Sphingomonas sp. NIBR02145]WHU01733.1 hypothetical protein O3305_16245 [Sphingomonas sp. NIBR02145]
MNSQTIDVIGDPALIAAIAALARQEGHAASEPMLTESISDALDAPFGVDEIRQVCEVVTIMMGAGTSVVGFLAAVKALLKRSEPKGGGETAVIVNDTQSQARITRLTPDTDISQIGG